MAKIFISYRRQDTRQIVASIYNFIAEAFGPESVYIDTKDTPHGDYFTRVIEQNLLDANVMLVIIGPNWFGPRNDGQSRIDEQDDVVRAEVRLGLELARQERLTLIPVLVDDASMPQSQQLPSDLSELPWINAAHMHSSLTYFTDDINRLLQDINRLGVIRRVTGRIEHAPTRFALLVGAQIVDSGSSQSPQATSDPFPPKPSTPLRPPSPVVKAALPTPRISVKDDLQLVLALLLKLPGLVKGAIVLAVIVGTIAAVQSLTPPKLTEHSSCQQFEQTDADVQTRVLQDMMAAHHSKDDTQTTRFLVLLYCHSYGGSAAIDGIYSWGSTGPSQVAATATTANVYPQAWSDWIGVTDYFGYRYGVRMTSDAFTPTAASAPVDVHANPGSDMLDLHFQIQNLQPDRSATFDLDFIKLFAPCGENSIATYAPNGQCIEGNAFQFPNYAPGQAYGDTFVTDMYLPAGATGDLHVYISFRSTAKYTDWTLWLNTCTGDGTPDCHLTGGKNLLVAADSRP